MAKRKPTAAPVEVEKDRKEKVSAPRRPRSIADLSAVSAEPEADAQRLPVEITQDNISTRRTMPLLAILTVALIGLASLSAGLAIERLVTGLLLRNAWLGWIGLTLTAVVVLVLAALLFREIRGFWRIAQIERLRSKAQAANEANDPVAARAVIRDLARLYANRAETAKGRAQLAALKGEVIDGRDLIALSERDLLSPLDRQAKRVVMESARRVSVVTAVSPRALIDLGFVLLENFRLVRRISELYGGRPGTIGLWRLAARVVTHLAATGAIAAGEGLLQQLVGHGLAARLSARLGEGLLNGMLTARIGIASIDLCRPVDFIHQKRPGLADFMSELVKTAQESDPSSPAPSKSPDAAREE